MNQTTPPKAGDNAVILRRLFDKLPTSFKAKVIASFEDSRTNRAAIFINYDNDEGDYFQSPFSHKGEENLWTVAKMQHGQIIPFTI